MIRTLCLFGLGTLLVAAPASAQTYDPSFPVCLQVYGRFNYNDCRYTSLAQCQLSAAGRSAQCIANPYYAAHSEMPRGRQQRRHAY